jgi:hypothetical protein
MTTGQCVWRCITAVVLIALAVGLGPSTKAQNANDVSPGAGPENAQNANDLADLSRRVNELFDQGKYALAVPIAERYVALAR